MLRQGLDRDGIAGIDLGLRWQRPAEIAPMHARCFHRKVMVTVLALMARGNAIRLRKCRALSRACRGMMAAQLRQRLLRPAALAGRHGGDRRALDFLLAKLARRQAKPVPEHPAEMRGIVKTVAVGDFRDRMMRLGRAGQFCRGPLQPALAQIMREARAGTLKQLLQIALGYALSLRHPRRRQIGIVELAFDGLAKTMQDGRLRRGAACFRRRRGLPHECRQQVSEALSDRRPFRIGQRFQIPRRRLQRA